MDLPAFRSRQGTPQLGLSIRYRRQWRVDPMGLPRMSGLPSNFLFRPGISGKRSSRSEAAGLVMSSHLEELKCNTHLGPSMAIMLSACLTSEDLPERIPSSRYHMFKSSFGAASWIFRYTCFIAKENRKGPSGRDPVGHLRRR